MSSKTTLDRLKEELTKDGYSGLVVCLTKDGLIEGAIEGKSSDIADCYEALAEKIPAEVMHILMHGLVEKLASHGQLDNLQEMINKRKQGGSPPVLN